MTRRLWLLATLPFVFCCSVGEGAGSVKSDRLFAKDCWTGPFDLDPNFFAANPDPSGDTMTIRIQRGDNPVEVSDGLLFVINDVSEIRENMIEQEIDLGLPIGVSPPGLPDAFNLNPPLVSATMYLHNTCHQQNAALHSIGGDIRFASLFSGDRNEKDAEDLLTEATFQMELVDPRDVLLIESDSAASVDEVLGQFPPDRISRVSGQFRFFFERGVPAQPFP